MKKVVMLLMITANLPAMDALNSFSPTTQLAFKFAAYNTFYSMAHYEPMQQTESWFDLKKAVENLLPGETADCMTFSKLQNGCHPISLVAILNTILQNETNRLCYFNNSTLDTQNMASQRSENNDQIKKFITTHVLATFPLYKKVFESIQNDWQPAEYIPPQIRNSENLLEWGICRKELGIFCETHELINTLAPYLKVENCIKCRQIIIGDSKSYYLFIRKDSVMKLKETKIFDIKILKN